AVIALESVRKLLMSAHAILFPSAGSIREDLSDEDFLKEIHWRKSADPKLVEAARTGQRRKFCRRLRKLLGRRFDTASQQSARSWTPQLLQPLWSQHAFDAPAVSGALLELLL